MHTDNDSSIAIPAPSAVSIPAPSAQVLPVALNLFKSLLFVSLLASSFWLAQFIATAVTEHLAPSIWSSLLKWSAVLSLATFDVLVLIGMGVLAHDAVHRVLLPSPFWNDLVGGTLSALTLIPFYANRQFHLTHHSHAHEAGVDPEEAMHNRPILIAMTVGSVVALLLQYRVLWRNLLRIREPRYAARAIKDLVWMAGVGLLYFRVLPAAGIALEYTILPVLVVFPPIFGWRALSDHYGIPAVERHAPRRELLEDDVAAWESERERRQQQVSGWVVLTSPWLTWLWSNVNYHEVHHKYPWLSYRYLPQAFAATRGRHAYLVVHGYWRNLWHLSRRPYFCSAEDVQAYRSH